MLKFLSNTGYDLDAKKDILDAFTESIGKSSLWVALALAVILVAVGVIINFKFRPKFKTFVLVAVSLILGFAISLSFVLFYITFTRMSINGDLTRNFWLLVGFGGTVFIAVITCALLKIFYAKGFKYAAWASVLCVTAYAVALICVLPTDKDTTPKSYGLYVTLSAILIIGIILGGILGDFKRAKTDNTKALTYAGICIAVSYGLSYIKFIDLPAGGSITLVSMLPIMLYAYMFGTRKGVIAGLCYGVLQSMQDPQIYEPLQVLLDYPVAFSALGLAGLFKGRKFLKGKQILELLLGVLLAGILRYSAHVLSGYFVFYSWAEWSEIKALRNSPLLYSLIYNLAILGDAILDAVVGVMLFTSKSLMTFVTGVNPKPSPTETENERELTDGESTEAEE